MMRAHHNGKRRPASMSDWVEWLEDRALLAAVVHVDAANAGAADGTPAAPFPTIQAAVDAVDPGGVVKVAKGTYVENVVVADKSVQLLGGFAGAGDFAAASPNGNLTRIRAQLAAEPAVYLQNVTDRDIVIDGFTITGGHNGIYVVSDFQQFSDVTISRNVIEQNGPAQLQPDNNGEGFAFYGGGVYSSNTNVTISNNTIRNNNANRGGGLFVAGGDGYSVLDNIIENNSGYDDHAGGVFLIALSKDAAGEAVFARNMVRGNVAAKAYNYGWAGGVLVAGYTTPEGMKPVKLTGNTFTDNTTPSLGGGLFVDDGATVVLDHCLFYDNHASVGGAAIFVDGYDTYGSTLKVIGSTIANNQAGPGAAVWAELFSTVTITNSILYGNGGDDLEEVADATITAKYSDIQDGTAGTGNFSANPLFNNPAAGDFSLKPGSPAIDKGDPASSFANEPAPNGGRVNLGHLGNTANATTSGGPTPTPRGTKTVLKQSAATTVKGKKLTLTATVTGLGTGAGKPAGKVRFYDGAKYLGVVLIKLVSGVAKAIFATTKLAIGTHSWRSARTRSRRSTSATRCSRRAPRWRSSTW
jgi:hypothetical protein